MSTLQNVSFQNFLSFQNLLLKRILIFKYFLKKLNNLYIYIHVPQSSAMHADQETVTFLTQEQLQKAISNS